MSKKLLAAGVVLTLVAAVLVGVGASTVSAQSMSLCQTVDALVAAGVISADKVAAAKAAAGCSAAVSSSCSSFTKDLTVGSTGADVTALQVKLGVSPATGYFGAITKAAVVAYQAANGITPASGYVGPITRAKMNYCAPVVVTPVTPVTPGSTLKGGAGDLDLSDTSTDVESSLKEGEEDVNVLGFKAEADGSDVEVTSIKITLENSSSTDGTSEKLSNYLDEVSIFMGSKKVGSADVSDFSKDSGTPDSFSKTISLSGAVVGEDDDEKFYVAVSAVSSIDTEDMTADWSVDVNTVRFTDATGAILTASLSSVDAQVFSFDDVSTDDQIDAKSSSSNPDDETVKVEENNTSDDYLALVFKLDVDDDSSDVMITSIPVVLTVAAGGTSADSIEDIIDAVTVTIDGNDYDADLSASTDTVENGSGTATYIIDFDDDEVTIDAGDVVDVKVTLTFNDQDGNYADNTTVVASVTPANIDAETSEDDITVGGATKTGAELTLSTAAATINGISWVKTSSDTTGTLDFFFTVEAEDGDFDVLGAEIVDDVTGGSFDNSSGVDSVSGKGQLTRVSGDSVETLAANAGFTVAEGDTTRFRVRYTTTTAGSHEVVITSVSGQAVADDSELSPTVTID